ncbi:superoxide reductase [Caloranaerobacter azorensis DSM 13643]|uniref:Superoxide reductase n=1 Tax=Caloranaerobacter azorensis DSM 13643 TaxID=1121264 RepID=A0A1M5RFS0_9FIRM|nr:class II SORL domain-containing protein [Caloranaerobacter azorensis]SHH24970.1 superoxide reductase [Caloranaerobacter azorensis DSM 13643]
MKSLGQLLQSGDWKGEKHVPVIQIPENIKSNEEIEIKVSVGEEIKHPNTLEHHISWIKVFYLPEGSKFPVELGTFNFTAHGENSILNEPIVVTHVKLDKSGTIYALSYCNLHGLWENSKEIKVQE